MRRVRQDLLVVGVLMLFFWTVPSVVQAQDLDGWTFRLTGVSLDASATDSLVSPTGNLVNYEADGANGFNFAFEFRVRPRFGIEFALTQADVDVTGTLTLSGTTGVGKGQASFEPFSVGVNVYLLPEGRVNLTLGLFGALAIYGDAPLATPNAPSFHYDAEDRFKIGAQVGLDFFFGEKGWGVTALVRYLDAPMLEEDPQGTLAATNFRGNLEVTPITFGIGVVKRVAG